MMLSRLEVTIPASSSDRYPIIIGENLLPEAGKFLPNLSSRSLIVTDRNVADLYLDSFASSLSGTVQTVILEAGEASKNLDNFGRICSAAVAAGLGRKDSIIALGGGVIGDISGFAAASYQRGVNFIQVPTTLLAMVDSSVGGKVAVNLPNAKNMIGAFYQPSLVLADVNTLNTLPERELKTGLAEVLKYAFLEKSCNAPEDFNLFTFLENRRKDILAKKPETLTELIRICAALKASVVNQDEKEKGLRAILNLGHTFAHALESTTGYQTYTHGEAVAIGLKGAFILAADKKLISEGYKEKSLRLLHSYALEYDIPESLPPKEIYAAMFHDKKASQGKISFILPSAEKETGVFSDLSELDILKTLNILKTPKKPFPYPEKTISSLKTRQN